LFRRTLAIARKEIRQLKRDTRLLFVIFFFPVFLLIIFGYAINFDVKHTKIAVYDKDKSGDSRNFINSLIHSEYFDLIYSLENEKQINRFLDEKRVQCVVIIPGDFSKQINSNETTEIQFLIDGIDGNTAAIIQNYVTAASFSFNQKITAKAVAQTGMKIYQPISLETRFWFNPDLETRRFLIPGLIAMILIVTAVVTVSLSLVREKERGTMEQLNVSPISSIELLIGKTFPFVILAMINAGFILFASYLLFGIGVIGSMLLLFITTLIFLLASTSIGIFVSAVSNSQQLAFSLATSLSLLPSVILSGFIFPIDSMPYLIQLVTNITPAKFFIVILRAIMVRGVGLEAFWEQVIYLFIFSVVVMTLATIISRKKARAV
jgi:ABC-2 type transport system permease protein